MWTTNRTLNAKVVPRPGRIAYLIPNNGSSELMDELIRESLSRWGGRRTPIIPTDGSQIESEYWDLLDCWDADIIYSYCELSPELEDRLYYKLAPAELVNHSEHGTDNYIPMFQYTCRFLSSLSLLPSFDRRAQNIGASVPEIVDNELWEDGNRDLADSFGFVTQSCIGALVHPHARRVSFRDQSRIRQHCHQETIYHNTFDEWLDTVVNAEPRLIMLSRLADIQCPSVRYLSDRGSDWNEHLTVVVGDTLNDRLLMWNAQHRYSVLNLYDDIPILRVSPDRLKSGIPGWLLSWFGKRNPRHIHNSNLKQVTLKSCSLSAQELEQIAILIRPKCIASVVHFKSPKDVFAVQTTFDSAQLTVPDFKKGNLRFRNNELEIPLVAPLHLDTSRPSEHLKEVWAAELTIERCENHSSSQIPDVWKFPRRLRLEKSIKTHSYGLSTTPRFAPITPPNFRPNKNGNLTVWDCADWTRPVLTLPTDYAAFSKAIREVPSESPSVRRQRRIEGNHQNPYLTFRFSRVSISDKGRDLLGVLRFFQSLPEALQFLNNKLLLQAVKTLSPEEPQDKKRYMKEICEMIRGLPTDADQESASVEQIAKRVLQFAAQSFASQSIKYSTFEAFYEEAKKQATDKKDRGNQIRSHLNSSITYLRNSGFLMQGFYWRCSVCEHENWLDLEHLSIISTCRICRVEHPSPVDGGLHFRLNPFVEHAFASSSAQGPVFWCLNKLRNLAERGRHFSHGTSSFSFAPALELYRHDDDSEPWTDIDITANLNGQIYLVEVKKSFAGMKPDKTTRLLELATIVRPDVVMFAVQEKPPEDESFKAICEDLATKLRELDVSFRLLTLASQLETYEDIADIALPYGEKLKWSAW